MYILRIIKMSSGGILSSSPMTYHSLSLFIESYARRRSINAIPNLRFVFILCYMIVCKIRACSVVVWCARNPACVGAWRFSVWAVVVSLWFMVAIKTFAKGGGIAMLR
jgi:hypothetical protein